MQHLKSIWDVLGCPDLLQVMGLMDFCSTEVPDLRDDVLYLDDDKAARFGKQVLSLIALGLKRSMWMLALYPVVLALITKRTRPRIGSIKDDGENGSIEYEVDKRSDGCRKAWTTLMLYVMPRKKNGVLHAHALRDA